MNSFLKMLGLILILMGVVCLALYAFSMPMNSLLVLSIALEVVGAIAYVLLNKRGA